LVAYYSFNGGANDVSGDDGVVSGAALVADRNGNPNSVYQFNNTIELKIGTSGTSAGFAGIIDEVRIYNYALTDLEISDLAQ